MQNKKRRSAIYMEESCGTLQLFWGIKKTNLKSFLKSSEHIQFQFL